MIFWEKREKKNSCSSHIFEPFKYTFFDIIYNKEKSGKHIYHLHIILNIHIWQSQNIFIDKGTCPVSFEITVLLHEKSRYSS